MYYWGKHHYKLPNIQVISESTTKYNIGYAIMMTSNKHFLKSCLAASPVKYEEALSRRNPHSLVLTTAFSFVVRLESHW